MYSAIREVNTGLIRIGSEKVVVAATVEYGLDEDAPLFAIHDLAVELLNDSGKSLPREFFDTHETAITQALQEALWLTLK